MLWQRLPTRRLRKLPHIKFEILADRSPDQKSTTILELRLKAISVCAKQQLRRDDPSSDGLH